MAMQVFDEILNQILTANPKLNRDDLVLMIEQKKKESHGLLSDEGAVRLVAQQLSIIPLSNIGLKDQRIRSVHAGLNDVTITGAVIALSEPYEFERSDGSHGKVCRIRLTDGSGELTCVFWDSHTDLVIRENISPGCQLRVLHGYTKVGQGGEVEYHLGNKSSFQILNRTTIQETSSITDNISSSFKPLPNKIKLRIIRVQTSRSKNGPTWALCHNDTGLLIGKFWDEHAESMLKVKLGTWYYVEEPYVEDRNGVLYVNVGSKSIVKKIEELTADSSCNPTDISKLTVGPLLWAVNGRVAQREDVREVQTKEGRRVKVSNLIVEDNTGKIRVSCWDEHADKVGEFRIGDSIKLVGVRVRQNMNGENEASTVFLTSLEKLQTKFS